MVRVDDRGDSAISSDRMVRSVVQDARPSHDEIRKLPERSSRHNFERRDRVKKLETSAG